MFKLQLQIALKKKSNQQALLNERHISSSARFFLHISFFFHYRSNPCNSFGRILDSELPPFLCMILICCRWEKPAAGLLRVSRNKQVARRGKRKQMQTKTRAKGNSGGRGVSYKARGEAQDGVHMKSLKPSKPS